jgi:hypothetical protein
MAVLLGREIRKNRQSHYSTVGQGLLKIWSEHSQKVGHQLSFRIKYCVCKDKRDLESSLLGEDKFEFSVNSRNSHALIISRFILHPSTNLSEIFF